MNEKFNEKCESWTFVQNAKERCPPNRYTSFCNFPKLLVKLEVQGRRRRGGSGGVCPRTFKSGGGAQVGLSPPPTFDRPSVLI